MPICANISLTPSAVTLYYEGGSQHFARVRQKLSCRMAEVKLEEGMREEAALCAIALRWPLQLDPSTQFMGDAWTETAGASQWRSLDPMRRFPWYVLMATPGGTNALGVMPGAAAFAQWSVKPSAVELLLDVRCGGRGVQLKDRVLDVATIISRRYELLPYAACRAFCKEMSADSILPSLPVYGNVASLGNRGRNSEESVLREAEELSSLTSALTNRPFEILAAGWQREDPDGPASALWQAGNERFPDMAGLAETLCNRGIRPGITLRLLQATENEADRLLLNDNGAGSLDPTCPEVIQQVQENIRRVADWGYQLVWHIASTRDILGTRWQFFDPEGETFPQGTEAWRFHDTGRTSAEVVRDFYRAIHNVMGDMVVIGGDVVGHLGVGMMHCIDLLGNTAENSWSRFCHNSVNALAFRNCQNNTFFAVAPGVLAIHSSQGWNQVRENAFLQSRSGVAFLTAFSPSAITARKCRRELAQCYEFAAMGDVSARPVDWMRNTCPADWEINGVNRHFDWYD